jgi:hypothetical protein
MLLKKGPSSQEIETPSSLHIMQGWSYLIVRKEDYVGEIIYWGIIEGFSKISTKPNS